MRIKKDTTAVWKKKNIHPFYSVRNVVFPKKGTLRTDTVPPTRKHTNSPERQCWVGAAARQRLKAGKGNMKNANGDDSKPVFLLKGALNSACLRERIRGNTGEEYTEGRQ